MRYSGRIVTLLFVTVVLIVVRTYGVLFYNFPPYQFPIIGVIVLLISWLLGTQYDKLKFLSEKDALTSLYNRRYLLQAWPKTAHVAARKQEKLILYFIDVDHFKMINDTRGHEIGDQVIKRIAHSLLLHSQKDDLVVRWAGDEYLIVSVHSDDKSRELMISRIHEDLKKLSQQIHIDIGVSIGSAVYPDDAQTIDDIIHVADQNMYALKTHKYE